MEGKRTIGKGSYHFEVGRNKPDPERRGKVLFDDCLHIWFKNKNSAISQIQSLLNQIAEPDINKCFVLSLSVCGELRFEKEE